MPLMEKRAVHIHASIKVSIRFIVAHGTHEELSPPGFDALPAVEGEPLPPGSAARAILARPVGIDLIRTEPRSPGFLSRLLIDLAAQLVRLFAVHAPRCASPMGFDLAQALKEQHAAGILCAHIHNATCHLVRRIRVHLAHVLPQLLITVFALDRLARLPLFFRDALEMPEACLIESMVSDKDGFEQSPVLPRGDDGEVFDVEIHRHRHQGWVKLALFDFLGGNLFHLGTVQFRGVLA